VQGNAVGFFTLFYLIRISFDQFCCKLLSIVWFRQLILQFEGGYVAKRNCFNFFRDLYRSACDCFAAANQQQKCVSVMSRMINVFISPYFLVSDDAWV